MNHPADLAYYRQLDADEAYERRFDEAATEIYQELTVTGGADDEAAASCLDFAKLRHAYLLLQKGARDEALVEFATEFCRAANQVAERDADDRIRDQDRANQEAIAEMRMGR